MHSDFYVYEHWRPDKDCCFYVGKGRRRRAWNLKHRNPHHRAVTSRLTSLGLAVDVRIVARGMTHETALAYEIEHLKTFDRALLVNMTDGGDGSRGHTHTMPEWLKQKISEVQRARIRTPDQRARAALVQTGRKHAAAAKAKVSTACKGRSVSTEWRQKIAASSRGKPKSETHRTALKTAWVRRKEKGLGSHSDETRAKMRAAHQRRLASLAA